jgi:hypothetical protein
MGPSTSISRHVLVGVALGSALLCAATGCESDTPSASSTTSPSTTAAEASTTPAPRPTEPGPADPGLRWANSTQFMEVRRGTEQAGEIHLEVRPAKKVVLGESFATEVIPGPYFDVTMTATARVLHLDGESGTAEAFLTDLARRDPHRPNHVTPDQRQEAFDVTFDSRGRVTRVNWLYVLAG